MVSLADANLVDAQLLERLHQLGVTTVNAMADRLVKDLDGAAREFGVDDETAWNLLTSALELLTVNERNVILGEEISRPPRQAKPTQPGRQADAGKRASSGYPKRVYVEVALNPVDAWLWTNWFYDHELTSRIGVQGFTAGGGAKINSRSSGLLTKRVKVPGTVADDQAMSRLRRSRRVDGIYFS